jgi:hypothetical protein
MVVSYPQRGAPPVECRRPIVDIVFLVAVGLLSLLIFGLIAGCAKLERKR